MRVETDLHRGSKSRRILLDSSGLWRRWLDAYREALLTPDAVATVLGLALLGAGWVLSGTGWKEYRGCYLASALIAGAPIVRTCLKSLREKRISVEVLVVIAIAASLIVGHYQAGAVVAVMLLGGGVLEQLTVARARRALTSLLVLVPQSVRIRRGDAEVEVPIEEVRLGDRVIIRPGERLAVDGCVVAGDSAADESPITGESVPIDKTVGDRVFAGSINMSGMLDVEVRKIGKDTTLGRILRLVEEAQESKAPVQRLADKYAQWYVPLALLLASLVWTATGNLVRGITVLIVFCPCALVLATPAAIVATIGHAARRVILVKGGAFMERVGGIHIVAFDKTGTLTVGKPQVTHVVPLNHHSPDESRSPCPYRNRDELLSLAASAERFSEHPLGQALCAAAEERQVPLWEPSEFQAFAGRGVQAQVNGSRVLVGRLSWLTEQNIDVPPGAREQALDLESDGQTVLGATAKERLIGLIALRDALRSEAKETIGRLKAQGVRVVMLTGDNERIAKAIAAEADIAETHAGLLPEDKLQQVREWQAGGARVAFIGDGINDAPALAAADVGIAMGVAGADVAMETSDIGFLNDDLMKTPEVIAMSRRMLKVIGQNIGFSVLVNLGSVVAAGMGWITPIGGAVIHETSALAVIVNAMRLLR